MTSREIDSRAEVVLVVARADSGVIGRDGKLPWHLPDDLKHFKAVTMGKPMVMGRKTFDSLPGLLPGRRHIVLTRDSSWCAEGAEVVADCEAALRLAGPGSLSVIGGAEIFALFLPFADAVELTEVHSDIDGDTILPAFDMNVWREARRNDVPPESGRPGYSFVRLERIA